ncbi:MAG: ABC transporter permease [Nodosilinea sp. LVE1205-7]
MRTGEMAITLRLGWELFVRNMVARHRNSQLGYLWLILSPLVLAGAWIFLKRSGNFQIPEANIPYGPYVVTGVFLWQGFSRQLNSSLSHLSASRHLFSKYRFPWEAIVLAGWAEAVVEFALSMGVLMVVLRLIGFGSLWTILLSLPLMASLLLLGSGVGLLLAPIGLLYEDIGRGIGLCLQLMFFLVPIVYPTPTEGIGKLVVEWNPVAVLLVAARETLLIGQVSMPFQTILASLVSMGVAMLALGFLRLARPHLAVRAG